MRGQRIIPPWEAIRWRGDAILLSPVPYCEPGLQGDYPYGTHP
jgi:hypothetical protein